MPTEQQLLSQLNAAQPVAEAAGPDWLRLILSLLLVLGLCVWVLRMLRPWLQKGAHKGLAIAPDKRLTVHHAVRLGGGNALHTVSIQGHVLVVGTGPSGSPRLIHNLNSSSASNHVFDEVTNHG